MRAHFHDFCVLCPHPSQSLCSCTLPLPHSNLVAILPPPQSEPRTENRGVIILIVCDCKVSLPSVQCCARVHDTEGLVLFSCSRLVTVLLFGIVPVYSTVCASLTYVQYCMCTVRYKLDQPCRVLACPDVSVRTILVQCPRLCFAAYSTSSRTVKQSTQATPCIYLHCTYILVYTNIVVRALF